MLAGQLEQEQVSAVARLPASLTTPLGVYSLSLFLYEAVGTRTY